MTCGVPLFIVRALERGPMSPKEIAERLGVECQEVSRCLWRLERRGVVLRLGPARWGLPASESATLL